MEWKDLAPWIAIAITLSLSILVPLFTQIANNKHQRKLQREKMEFEQSQKRHKAYEDFLLNVGGTVIAGRYNTKDTLSLAAASIHILYIYAPVEWQEDLDNLSLLISKLEWGKATPIVQKLSKQISKELNINDHL